MKKPASSTLLKIISVLMIAFGLYSLFAGFTFINATEETLREVMKTTEEIAVDAIHTYGYVTLAIGGFMAVAGLAGFMFGSKKEKANIIIGFGAAYLLLAVVSIFTQLSAGIALEITTFTPLLLPLIYVYCGITTKRS